MKYTREFLLSLKDSSREAPAGFQAPKEASNAHVMQLRVVKRKEKSTDAPTEQWRETAQGQEDYLGPEERAKLEEIQRLVRQQQPVIRINFNGAERESSAGPSPSSKDLAFKWVAKQDKTQPAPVAPTPETEAEAEEDSSLNPNANPFVSSFPEPTAAAQTVSDSTSPTDNTNAATSASSDESEDSDPPWDSDVELPPPPLVTGKPRKVENDVWRLKQRQKQIRIGLQTVGYKNYLRAKDIGFHRFPGSQAEVEVPRKPNVYQVCSKRAWDGQIRRWRQLLHKYDELTDVLWNEEEAKEVHAIKEKHKKFKEKVRRQQEEAFSDGTFLPGDPNFPLMDASYLMYGENMWGNGAIEGPTDGAEGTANGGEASEATLPAATPQSAATKLSCAAAPYVPQSERA